MPELPEVETVRRTLMPLVVGRTIRGVLFLWEGLVANVSLPELRAHLVDGSITDISRRGKYLVVHIGGRGYLVVHLRMTGRLLVAPLAAPYERHLRGLIDLGHDESLRFADQRKFGRFYWADDETGLAAIIRVGIEPLAPDFTPEALASMTANGKAAIKAVLLDQTRLAGLGNIYADESLFRAGILPQRRAGSLDAAEIGRLWEAIRVTLADALVNNGTTFRDYVDGEGRAGHNQDFLLVYGRDGEKCVTCGTLLQRDKVAGRGTVFCPQCQH